MDSIESFWRVEAIISRQVRRLQGINQSRIKAYRLVDVAKDLSTDVLAASLLVVKDAGRSRLFGNRQFSANEWRLNGEGAHQDDETELTSREQQVDPVLDLVDGDVVAGRDDTGLVQAAVELNNDLARAVVVDDLELADVAYKSRPSQQSRTRQM